MHSFQKFIEANKPPCISDAILTNMVTICYNIN